MAWSPAAVFASPAKMACNSMKAVKKLAGSPKKIALVGAGSIAIYSAGKHFASDSFYAPPWMEAMYAEKKAAVKSMFGSKKAEK